MLRDYQDPVCSVAAALGILGDGWTMLIIRDAFLGSRRFADFEGRLAISKNVLSSRLSHLVEQGILEKVDAGQFGARYEYQLSRKGKDLLTVITALRQWGDKWVFGEGNAPIEVIDAATGQPILPVRIRRADGEVVPSGDLVVRAREAGGE